ncbi:MarR family winged helix-turn-helix transcriptional regulator [Demequina capsici]|uniref:MarR family winged helix-turn-helix transcriptional regulator n=1 Tax=Demequina capsici TaxID=3075620 RepID=A0AA96J9J4_9MICO|nr:MarR family winged helix-turn-helix transcriptional regulator [Demequina sp. OYTSA14]WNM23566.1 MarR family winged helix-turn-helix transcriptional regulator [Demequina sp. OYTSA14]
MERRTALEQLLAQSHRVTRIAAAATGSATPSSHRSVLALLARDGDHRVGEIAAELRLTQPGATQVVTALAEEGLVERCADPDDGRATRVSITPAGRTSVDHWRRDLSDALSPMLGELDDDDWAAIARTAALLASIDRSPR